MPYTTKLPYNHFAPSKPTKRITYHGNGTKTEIDLRERTPNVALGARFRGIVADLLPTLEKSIGIRRVKGEYDNYDMTRNSYVEEAHKEI